MLLLLRFTFFTLFWKSKKRDFLRCFCFASHVFSNYGIFINGAIDMQGTSDTRKLCYREGDRAMRPIYGCPENFPDSLTAPTAIFPKFYGLLFRWYRPKERWRTIYTRFRDIAAFVPQHATFSYPTSGLPKISPCSPGSRWIAFWLQRANVLG